MAPTHARPRPDTRRLERHRTHFACDGTTASTRCLRAFILLLFGFCLVLGFASAQSPSEETLAYESSSLEPWLVSQAYADRLRTPKAALERFLAAGGEGAFDDAARVLNLTDLPVAERRERGADLARRLHLVLARRVDIDWRGVPDRPDGANDLPRLFTAEGDGAGGAPEPRRNLLIGLVDLGDREAEIRLERVRPPNLQPVWLIARSTVDDIDRLYAEHGPGWLERVLPAWALAELGQVPTWQWFAFLILVAASVLLGMLLQRLVLRILASSNRRWARGLGDDVARPLILLTSLIVLWTATGTLLTLSGPLGRWTSRILAIALVVTLTWLGTSIINFFSEHVGRQHIDRLVERDERRARRHLTYLSVARRVLVFTAVLLGLGVMLAQFDAFRTLGASLLASAGVAGIVLGIAAQGSLANVMAGIQIALTQLVRIGDTVYFDGEWAYVEDITYTFVILRTWDQRRIAVPNKHVIAHPLENWEMTSSHLTMPVELHVDYGTPLDVLRRHYEEVLEAAEDWDREERPSLQAVDADVDALKVRFLCSAKDAMTAWNLHCHLREEMVAFLRTWEDGRYLPRRRTRIEGERLPAPHA